MGEAGRGRWAVWTAGQRGAIGILVAALCVWLGWKVYWDRAIDRGEGAGWRASELDDRVDPNVASAGELATLPGVGEEAAGEIVAYRERFIRDGRGPVAFRDATDLLKVNGIGAAGLDEMLPHLRFPNPPAATRLSR